MGFWDEVQELTVSFAGYDGTEHRHYRTYTIPAMMYRHDITEDEARRYSKPGSYTVGPEPGERIGLQSFTVKVVRTVVAEVEVRAHDARVALTGGGDAEDSILPATPPRAEWEDEGRPLFIVRTADDYVVTGADVRRD